MSDDILTQIDDLLEEADGLDNGPSKIVLLEEALGLADTHGLVAVANRNQALAVGGKGQGRGAPGSVAELQRAHAYQGAARQGVAVEVRPRLNRRQAAGPAS